MQLWQLRQEHDQPWGDERSTLVRVVNVRVQVWVHCAQQRLQGEDADLHQADSSHHWVNMSRPEQGLSGWVFPRMQAGGDENCSELREDNVHQVLGNRACAEEEDQCVW